MASRSSLIPILGLVLVAILGVVVWQLDLLGLESKPNDITVDLVDVPLVDPDSGPAPIQPPVDRQPDTGPDRPISTGVVDLGERFGGVAGRVVDINRRAVAGAQVSLHEAQFIQGLSLPASLPLLVITRATTDANGAFTFEGVPTTSQLIVRVTSEEHARTDAGAFQVTPDKETDVGSIVAERGITLTGNVRDRGARPIAGAQVGLYDGLPTITPDGEISPALRTAVTDEDGQFAIHRVAKAAGAVFVQAEGFASQYKPIGSNDAELRFLEVSVTLEPPAPIVGRTQIAREGRPLADVLIEAMPIGQDSAGLGAAISDEDGNFELPDLAPGKYFLRATHPDHSMATQTSVRAGNEEPVVLSLKRRGTMRGFVVDDEGLPIKRYDFRARFSKRKTNFAVASGTMTRISDPKGAFSLKGLDPGFYTLDAWAPGYALSISEPIRIKQGQDLAGVQLALSKAATIVGRVIDDIDRPVKGVKVSMHPNKESPDPLFRNTLGKQPWLLSTMTDGEGRFRLDPVTAMTYQVQISHPDHAIVRLDDVVATTGKSTDMGVIEIPRSATMTGYVVDGAGQPVAGVTVSLYQRGAPASRRTTTNSKGDFVFDRLAPGEYAAEAFSNNIGLGGLLNSSVALLRKASESGVRNGTATLRDWTSIAIGQTTHVPVTLIE